MSQLGQKRAWLILADCPQLAEADMVALRRCCIPRSAFWSSPVFVDT